MTPNSSNAVRLSVLPSNVAVIAIDLPDSSVNVLSGAVLTALDSTLNQVMQNGSITGVVITSGKDGTFVAGADLNEIAALQSDRNAIIAAVTEGKGLFDKIEKLSHTMPVVCAINGVCLGGGTELALSCGVRIATANAELGLPEVGLGFLPGLGGCVRLTRLIGAVDALRMITAPTKRTEAKKAWRLGLVDEVVKDGKLLERAEAIALGASPKRAARPLSARLKRWYVDSTPMGRRQMVSQSLAQMTKGAAANYPAPPAVLKVVKAALTRPAAEAFKLETELFADLASGEVSQNLVGMFFATQAAKKVPGDAKPVINPGMIGIAGAGVMGASIAQVALYAGYPVVLYDISAEQLKKGVDKIHSLFEYLVKKGKISREQENNFLSSLAATTDIDGLKHCELVIEAIIEKMAIKKKLIADLDKAHNGRPYIFASNTSSLSITQMCTEMEKPENSGILHFFNPAEKLPLVEVVAGDKSSPETVASLMQFVSRLPGKYAVVCKDRPGMIVNRILIPYGLEAIRLLESGVAPEEIEAAMLEFGMAMGPLTVVDEVGLDVASKVVHILHDAFGERMAAPKLLSWIEAQPGLLGKKTGKGLFIWEDGKPAGFNPDVLAALDVPARAARTLTRQEIQERLVMVMINEASRVLEEGIVESASQIDLAMIMGCGFPPYRGGILRYADKLGAAHVVERLNALKGLGDNYKPSDHLLGQAQAKTRFYA